MNPSTHEFRGRRASEGGFTMVELMVVMAIISLLALTAMRTYFTTREKVMDAAALSDARSLGTAVANAFVGGTDVNLAHDPADGSKIGTRTISDDQDRRPIFKLTNGMQAEIIGNSNYLGLGYGFCSAEVWWPGSNKTYVVEIDEKSGEVSTPGS